MRGRGMDDYPRRIVTRAAKGLYRPRFEGFRFTPPLRVHSCERDYPEENRGAADHFSLANGLI